MNQKRPIADTRRLPLLTRCLSAIVLTGAVVSFGGWLLDLPRLTDWFDLGISIQPNTCVLMALAAAGISLLHFGARRIATVLGAVTALVAGLTLLQYIVGADFGFNHQLLLGREWGQASTVTRGRMGPPASSAFILIGVAVILLSLADRWPALRRFVPSLGMGVCIITLFSIMGYLYGARNFFALPWLSAIALQTSLMFTALGIGVIACVRERDPMRMINEESAARVIARVFLPLLIVLPVVITVLREEGEELGFYDAGTGRALSSIALIIASVSILWWTLLALRKREVREHEAQRKLFEQTELLREADRRKDEFIAILGHELRNPLTVIDSAAQLMRLAPKDTADHDDVNQMLDEQVKHLRRLVDDLLDVSRVTRGKVTLRRETVRLGAVIRQAVDAIRPLASAQNQTLHLCVPDEEMVVDGDETRLVQVVSNVTSNASKFTPDGGRIDVTLAADPADASGAAIISIRDSGQGMDDTTIRNIFQPFYQARAGAGGLGIGLTLVKTLVELHGGSVRACSDGVGRGSEFIIRLPVTTRPHGATPGA